MLAHELRNPLTPITHAIHLLRHGAAGSSPRRSCTTWSSGSNGGGSYAWSMNCWTWHASVAVLIELKRETSGSPGVLVQVRCGREPPCVSSSVGTLLHSRRPDVGLLVDADPVRLEQVISNLLDNAAKYTNPGGRIALTLARENGEAVLRRCLRDNGIGLAPESAGACLRSVHAGRQLPRALRGAAWGLGLACRAPRARVAWRAHRGTQ